MRIGIDLGGSKIEAVVLDQHGVVARRRIRTPQGDYAATLNAVRELVVALEREQGGVTLPVGLGHPGSIDPHSGLLRNANSTCLNGRPLQQDLEQRLGRKLALANDASCLALSEAHDGAAGGADSAFCVILGTGVGGALLVKGQLLSGRNALAGEWGHNPAPWAGEPGSPPRRCWCGLDDCLETWLSGPGLLHSYQAAGGQADDAAVIASRARQGDQLAQQTLSTYAGQLGRALAGVINLFDPQRIVLAGGLSQIDSLYHELPAAWTRWVFAEQVDTELLPARHGDASGVLGAARLEV